jgi:hypothetical protein
MTAMNSLYKVLLETYYDTARQENDRRLRNRRKERRR